MNLRLYIITFCLLFAGLALHGQAPEKRFVGNCRFSGFTLLADSSYRGDIINFTDRMGDGYNLTQLAVGYEIFDGRGLVFEIDTIHESTNFTADVSVTARVDRGFAPFGSGQVYNPTENGLIPPSSQEQAGLSPTQKARIDRHNVVIMQSLIGGRDSVYSITNVPDTTGLSPVLGDAFINSTADTLGLYNGAGWVLFFGGGSIEVADGLTILGDGTGGDPFRVDTTLLATRTYADSLFSVADSLREAGDRSTPILIQAFDRIIQLDGCSTSETVITGFQLIDDTAIDEGAITFEIGSPQSVTYDVYNADSTSYYFETSVSRAAGIYTWEVGYTDPDGNFVGDTNLFEVAAGTPDTVTVPLNDSVFVTRRCGVEIRRDTIIPADNVTGTGASPRVALWSAAQTLTSSANLAYTSPLLTLGGTGASLLLTPTSAPVNAAGKWYTSSGNYPHFMNGTTDWPLVRGSIESFTPGSLLFAGTSGQAQQDNANFFVDDTNDRVGIGTNSPSELLHVRRDQNTNTMMLLQNNSTGSAAQTNIRSQNSAGSVAQLGIYGTGNSGYGALQANRAYVYTGGIGTSNTLVLMADRAGAGGIVFATGGNTEKARIDFNGHFGLGTSSPQRTAHIAGEARITDLDTDPATKVVGADADGDLSAAAPGTGLAFTAGGVLYADTAFLATLTDLPGTLYSVNGTIPDGRVATVEIAGTFTLRNLDGFIKIGDDQGNSSGSAITIDNDSEDVIVNAYSHRLQGPTHDPTLLGILEAGVRVLKLGDHEDVGNSTTIQLYDDTEIIRLHADSAISMKGTSYDYMFPKANPGVNQVLGEGATDDNQLEWMDVVIDGGMTNDFLPRYDETSGTLVDSDIEDDGTTITAGFNRDEVEIIPLNSITMFVDNDSINIYGPVTRIGSTDNDTYVRVVDSSPTLVDAKAEEIHLTGEIYAPALSEYSGGGYYNIVQLPGTKEIRYDTVYARVYGYLYGAPLDSLDLGGATDQASITGWTAGGYNSGHFTATDSSLIYSGPTHRVEVQFDGKLIGGAAGDVEIRIGYSTSAGSGTLVLPADQTERITLTGGSTRDQFYTSCQMQLADGYEIKARGARGDFGIREARLRVMQID